MAYRVEFPPDIEKVAENSSSLSLVKETGKGGKDRKVSTTGGVAANRPAHLTADEIIDIDAGKISAVLIECDFGLLWFAFNDDFQPGDDIPAFYASELPFLRQMTPDELRRRYAEKQALGGGWIRNSTDEPTKH